MLPSSSFGLSFPLPVTRTVCWAPAALQVAEAQPEAAVHPARAVDPYVRMNNLKYSGNSYHTGTDHQS